MKSIIVTGCAGFIGSNFLKKILVHEQNYHFLIIDNLTYAGHFPTIEQEIAKYSHLEFKKIDIADNSKVQELYSEDLVGIINFAAESHVDNSIHNPSIFVQTNVNGTLNLLNLAMRAHNAGRKFRYLQVSTDEVYGALSESDPAFTEDNPIQPNSPYSASKASGDLLVRSYVETFKLDAITTRCSNNYGAYQFPEKLIPLIIKNAVADKNLPVYGDGRNIRDWIHVDDHCAGIWAAFTKGQSGEVYNFGGQAEMRNIDIVKLILKHLNKSEDLIEFVEDRKGHDWRYAIDFSKAKKELDWTPTMSFEQGLKDTITWYLNNQDWVKSLRI